MKFEKYNNLVHERYSLPLIEFSSNANSSEKKFTSYLGNIYIYIYIMIRKILNYQTQVN